MIDTTLIDKLKALADKEKKIKEYKRRVRIKGIIITKGETQKGNITLIIQNDDGEYKITVLKTHKERFSLAQKFNIKQSVYVEGVAKLRVIICTKLKRLEKGLMQGKQEKLTRYETK
ncbi:TPA: hypothetical protein HA235_07625 [Candidatus Woesearchaeota archaeon]|nr:hypothetical protein [Candidatus Woesearchaeota archaeon]HIH32548.1 hypothetical protein [Candidatus Woesearchaeota archaeon]HIJ02085.1 hypothetical protein [Candidatus Woesearchaeota archaeon]